MLLQLKLLINRILILVNRFPGFDIAVQTFGQLTVGARGVIPVGSLCAVTARLGNALGSTI